MFVPRLRRNASPIQSTSAASSARNQPLLEQPQPRDERQRVRGADVVTDLVREDSDEAVARPDFLEQPEVDDDLSRLERNERQRLVAGPV